MSTASRIDDETVEQVNRHSSRMTQLQLDVMQQRQRSQASIQNDRRRAAVRVSEELEEECARLRAALAEAHELINLWAQGCELFSRATDHLRKHWVPKPGAETDVNQILAKANAAIQHDPAWPSKRDAHTERQRQQLRKDAAR